MENTDVLYMRRAMQLAQKGMPYAAPNPIVGAVIVCDGKIIGEGYHRICGGPHAEVNAVNSVKDKSLLSRSTIYVTLEPCSHYGKTPPCADMLVENHLKRVVIGCVDPFARVHGNGIRKLEDAGIEVTVGVCGKECLELIGRFRTFHEKKRPYVILKWAQSADGFIDVVREGGRPVVISDSFNQMMVHKLRSECAAILVGTNTARLDNPTLTVRKWSGRNPMRVVIDRKLVLDRNLNLFDGSVPTLVFTESQPQWEKENVTFVVLEKDSDMVQSILHELYERNVQALLVEGGSALLQSFIDSGMWDEARVETGMAVLHNGVAAPQLKDFRLVSSRDCFASKVAEYTKNVSKL